MSLVTIDKYQLGKWISWDNSYTFFGKTFNPADIPDFGFPVDVSSQATSFNLSNLGHWHEVCVALIQIEALQDTWDTDGRFGVWFRRDGKAFFSYGVFYNYVISWNSLYTFAYVGIDWDEINSDASTYQTYYYVKEPNANMSCDVNWNDVTIKDSFWFDTSNLSVWDYVTGNLSNEPNQPVEYAQITSIQDSTHFTIDNTNFDYSWYSSISLDWTPQLETINYSVSNLSEDYANPKDSGYIRVEWEDLCFIDNRPNYWDGTKWFKHTIQPDINDVNVWVENAWKRWIPSGKDGRIAYVSESGYLKYTHIGDQNSWWSWSDLPISWADPWYIYVWEWGYLLFIWADGNGYRIMQDDV